MLSERLMQEIGVHLGQRFTQGELESLCGLLGNAAEGCNYAAEDYAERADFERKHHHGGPYDINEEDDYRSAAEGFTVTSAKLGELIAAIQAGEKLGREDHPA